MVVYVVEVENLQRFSFRTVADIEYCSSSKTVANN
jgi:hypothetical protein